MCALRIHCREGFLKLPTKLSLLAPTNISAISDALFYYFQRHERMAQIEILLSTC